MDRRKSRARAHRSSHKAPETELDRFAQEFSSEDRLRRVVADLLGKMGRQGVRITHGPTEKGKDIIFYGPGGLDERRLFACVIKNGRISGAVSSKCSAREVLVQAEQAFAEPYISLGGEEERVDSVYVMSPLDPTPAAIESICHQLRRTGPIEFFCGRRLLDLFVKYWPQFLWFESTVLESYLCGVRTDLNRDSAIASLILRKTYLAELPRSFADIYVPSGLRCALHTFALRNLPRLSPELLEETFSKGKVDQVLEQTRHLSSLIPYVPIWQPESSIAILRELSIRVGVFQRSLSAAWDLAFSTHAKEIGARQGRAGLDRLSETGVSLRLSFAPEVKAEYLATVKGLERVFGALEDLAVSASRFASVKRRSPSQVIRSSEYLSYCRVADVARVLPSVVQAQGVPAVFQFTDSILTQCGSSLLIVGPAGYGKTSFCKWHALKDAQDLLDGRSEVLPIVVSLHALSEEALESGESAFFRSPELRKLIGLRATSTGQPHPMRLYLDGLDEVPTQKQARIVSLAKLASKQIPNIQIILTARDHVIGPWLGWLPRIQLRELDPTQVRTLAKNWLQGSSRASPRFLDELENHSALVSLMSVPLLGTLILAVYRKTGTLPPNKARLYALFVELLTGGWDLAKGVKRETKFGPQDKLTVLTRLAALLHLRGERDGTEPDLRTAIDATLGGFSRKWRPFLNELIEDGLLVRIGPHLCFSHLSFQEYMVATDLVDPTGQRSKQALMHFFGGRDWWKEVLLFFVSLTNRPLEMEDWLIRNARECSAERQQLVGRLTVLQQGLYEANPGYKSPFKGIPVLEPWRDIHVPARKDQEFRRKEAWQEFHLEEMEWLLAGELFAPEETE